MSLAYDRLAKQMTLWCDSCNESELLHLSGASDFGDFIELAKEKGWAVRKENGEWNHYCEACR